MLVFPCARPRSITDHPHCCTWLVSRGGVVQVRRHPSGQRPRARRVGECAPQPPRDRMEGNMAAAAVSLGLGPSRAADGAGAHEHVIVNITWPHGSRWRAVLVWLPWLRSADECAHCHYRPPVDLSQSAQWPGRTLTSCYAV